MTSITSNGTIRVKKKPLGQRMKKYWGFYLMFAAPILIRFVRGESPEPFTVSAVESAPQKAPETQPEKAL